MSKNTPKTNTAVADSRFMVIGLNYQKADAETRGHFSVSPEAQLALLNEAKAQGVSALSVISTCNRTEIYGFARSADQLIDLLCSHTAGNKKEFLAASYIHTGNDAIRHLFRVGTGLDSQILGDFEIISQLRRSFKQAKNKGLLNPFMERLINEVIRASKRIKNETALSSGATSVSFAAVQYILARVPYVTNKNILLFGTGKIGRNTCENLIKHTRNDHITFINRTRSKAEKIAGKFNLIVSDYANLQSEIAQADILIVATGAQMPTVSNALLHLKKPLLILDLSIPKNVAQDVENNPLVHLVHLDQLSKIADDTLSERALQVPKAYKIIESIEAEFYEWVEKRKFAPTLRALKQQLNLYAAAEIDNQRKKLSDFNEQQAQILTDRIVQKITTQVANHLNQMDTAEADQHELIRKVFNLQTEQ